MKKLLVVFLVLTAILVGAAPVEAAELSTFFDLKNDFSIPFPVGWQVVVSDGFVAATFSPPRAAAAGPSFTVMLTSRAEPLVMTGEEVDKFAASNMLARKKRSPAATLAEKGILPNPRGSVGYLIVNDLAGDAEKTPFTTQLFFTMRSGKLFIFEGKAPSNKMAEFTPIFLEMLAKLTVGAKTDQ